jgi:hypothetical protein
MTSGVVKHYILINTATRKGFRYHPGNMIHHRSAVQRQLLVIFSRHRATYSLARASRYPSPFSLYVLHMIHVAASTVQTMVGLAYDLPGMRCPASLAVTIGI